MITLLGGWSGGNVTKESKKSKRFKILKINPGNLDEVFRILKKSQRDITYERPHKKNCPQFYSNKLHLIENQSKFFGLFPF